MEEVSNLPIVHRESNIIGPHRIKGMFGLDIVLNYYIIIIVFIYMLEEIWDWGKINIICKIKMI